MSRFERFGFPRPKIQIAPSDKDGAIKLMMNTTSIMFGVLLCSLLANIILLLVVIYKADTLPYVADGGIFGCSVKVIAELWN